MPPTIDTTAAAFLAGLVTSLHCVGMCGPLACSWAVARSNSFVRDTAIYHAARLFAYALVGALAGALGTLPVEWLNHRGVAVFPLAVSDCLRFDRHWSRCMASQTKVFNTANGASST